MKLKDIYEFVVKKGIEQDPRDAKTVRKTLEKARKAYEELKAQQKEEFDKEALVNPYADTRILNGAPDKQARKILVGIDVDVGEVLLADRLKQMGRPVDLIMAHHPGGRAYAGFYEVMHMQTDILAQLGVPVNVAEALVDERIKEVSRRVHSANHTRTQDAAKLLDIALMCVHTPADNHVTAYLKKLVDSRKPEFISDLLTLLKEVPEYEEASRRNAGPKLALGLEKNRCGKVVVEMTGGTEGSKDIFKELSKAGVSTIVSMHLSDDHIKKAQAEHINVVIAGHIPSDTLGLNLLLDELVKKDKKIEIIACSGFVRIKR